MSRTKIQTLPPDFLAALARAGHAESVKTTSRSREAQALSGRKERKAPVGGIVTKSLATNWETPPELKLLVQRFFRGKRWLDPATTKKNPMRASCWIAPPKDGLAVPWRPLADCAFVNPPYGRVLRLWLSKIVEEADAGFEQVLLLPAARFEQLYWQQLFDRVSAQCMIRKRVSFIRPETGDRVNGNPYASLFLGLNVDVAKFGEVFSEAGHCYSMAVTGKSLVT